MLAREQVMNVGCIALSGGHEFLSLANCTWWNSCVQDEVGGPDRLRRQQSMVPSELAMAETWLSIHLFGNNLLLEQFDLVPACCPPPPTDDVKRDGITFLPSSDDISAFHAG